MARKGVKGQQGGVGEKDKGAQTHVDPILKMESLPDVSPQKDQKYKSGIKEIAMDILKNER